MGSSPKFQKRLSVKESRNVSPKVTKFVKDWIMDPTSPVDVATTLVGGKSIKVGAKLGARAVAGISKAGAKHVEKIYRNIG